jgi:hypothetical protein
MIVPAAVLLLVLLFTGACSDKAKNTKENNPPQGETEVVEETTSPPTTVLETTGEPSPPEVTLSEDPRGEPEVVIRLEGDPETTFSGLCSMGEQREVLSGRVPKRFAFDLKGRQLSCRIEKQDGGNGDLKIVLIAGETTRSVQQTNAPGSIINVSYAGG